MENYFTRGLSRLAWRVLTLIDENYGGECHEILDKCFKNPFEQKSKIDKEVVQLKYKGNQKQYELNAELDSIIESIETESERGEPNLPLIKKYSQEARELIRKRQKLIKIADKSKDGWQVVAEYESDELASDSEDEKRLKKARETASRKRRQKDQLTSGSGKKARAAVGSDNQLFRGKKNCLQFTL